jgi:hypothetical protein
MWSPLSAISQMNDKCGLILNALSQPQQLHCFFHDIVTTVFEASAAMETAFSQAN